MVDSRSDRIAREAARLLDAGRVANIHDAIRMAADALDLTAAPSPGVGRVRKHAQAMAMQLLGQREYESLRLSLWNTAEQIMTVLEHELPDTATLLVGRAARGLIDAGVTVHIRAYTKASSAEIAQALVDHEYPEPRFQVVESLRGRMDQICFRDDLWEVAVLRCIPPMPRSASTDLVTGKPVDAIDLSALRKKLEP